MAKIEVTLKLQKRAWVSPMLQIAAYSCALTSLFSERAADWISDKATTFIANHGFCVRAQ